MCVYIYIFMHICCLSLPESPIDSTFLYHQERRCVKDTSELMLQACCAVCDAFQLALGVSFYSGTSELILVSMRLEDVLQRGTGEVILLCQ